MGVLISPNFLYNNKKNWNLFPKTNIFYSFVITIYLPRNQQDFLFHQTFHTITKKKKIYIWKNFNFLMVFVITKFCSYIHSKYKPVWSNQHLKYQGNTILTRATLALMKTCMWNVVFIGSCCKCIMYLLKIMSSHVHFCLLLCRSVPLHV